jgi:hypothetical protein
MFSNDQRHIPREIVLKVRLSQAESDALARLTATKDMGASAVVRQLIVRAANTN